MITSEEIVHLISWFWQYIYLDHRTIIEVDMYNTIDNEVSERNTGIHTLVKVLITHSDIGVVVP